MPLAVGGALIFDEGGGTVAIGPTRVDVVDPLARPVVVGNRYLLFGAVGSYLPSLRDGFRVTAETAYEVVGGRLRRIRTYGTEQDEIEELPLQDVLNRVVFAVQSALR